MASDRPIESKTRHPVLGPAVAIYDDRSRTWWRLGFWIFLIPVGVFGVSLASGDIAKGDVAIGVAQATGGVVLTLYSIRAAVVDAQRLANPVCLLVARDGFELFPGRRRIPWFELFPSRHPISWNDVESIGDLKYPDQPRALRLQLEDPHGFAERQALGPLARIMLRVNRGDLVLGGGMAMPIAKVEGLMRRQLVEFRRPASTPASTAAHHSAPRNRRPSRTR